MTELLAKLLSRAGDLLGTEPILILFFSAALVAVFLATTLGWRGAGETANTSTIHSAWSLYRQLTRIVWGLLLVTILTTAAVMLRSYLNHTMADFRQTHGRVSEANLQAVRTIWGEEQDQHELTARFWYQDEETERLQSEDPTRPAMLRKKKVQHTVTGNPFVKTRHEITLRQNPRRKGSAVYPGYETECRFMYRLKNLSDRDVNATLRFPLPSSSAMYTGLAVNLDGKSVLDQLEMNEGWLVVQRDDVPRGEVLDLEVAFKSRGLSYWYFQVQEPREIRDFLLTMRLPDLAQSKINYPEGCMTPTELAATPDGRGSLLTYRLDRAISNKGMGVDLPKLTQPGQATSAVLLESVNGWLLMFSAVVLGLTLAGVRFAALISVVIGAAAAFGYGLLADFSEFFIGLCGAYLIIFIPLYALLGWLLLRIVTEIEGRLLALELALFGALYPFLAGIDAERQTLYLNIVALMFLSMTAWQLMRRFGGSTQSAMTAVGEPSV